MSDENRTKLQVFVNWYKRPFVDKMLDEGMSPRKCAEWCNENGFEISVPTMYSYDRKRKEAIIRGIHLEYAMGNRGLQKAGTEIKIGKAGRPKGTKNERKDAKKRKQKAKDATEYRIKSDIELLDVIMQKGVETIVEMEEVKPEIALKAMELKYKLTGGQHGGITIFGLEEIRLREQARENAILAILLEYIPEEKIEEVVERMEKATKEYYESMGMGDAYEETQEDTNPQEDSHDHGEDTNSSTTA